MNPLPCYRVLRETPESAEFLVRLVEDDRHHDEAVPGSDGRPIRVRDGGDDSIRQAFTYTDPGHLLRLDLAGDEPYRAIDAAHEGGVTLVHLDPWLPPYYVLEVLKDGRALAPTETDGTVVVPILDTDSADPLAVPTPVGECLLFPEGVVAADFEGFLGSPALEAVLTGFETIAGEPTEVLVSDPVGLPFWCALSFDTDWSTVATRIRSQYGQVHNGQFVANPLLVVTDVVGRRNQPANPDANPEQTLGNDWQHFADKVPPRAGQASLDLLRELFAMGKGTSLYAFSPFGDDEESNTPLEVSLDLDADVYAESISGIGDALLGYLKLQRVVYERYHDADEPFDLDEFPVELLYRAERILRQLFALHVGYADKMDKVDIEEYILPVLKTGGRKKLREFHRNHPGIEPLTDQLQGLLHDHRDGLDQLHELLATTERIASVAPDEAGKLTPTLPLDSDAYEAVEDTLEAGLQLITEDGSDPTEVPQWLADNITVSLFFNGPDSADWSPVTARCQARLEWFGDPTTEFKTFRTV